MPQDYSEHLRPVGGYLDVARELLPDLSLAEAVALSNSPKWDASIHIRYKGDEAKLTKLIPIVEQKLRGRLPTSSSGNELLIVDFLVENDDDTSIELVDDFSKKLIDSLDGVVDVTEVTRAITSTGDETVEAALRLVDN